MTTLTPNDTSYIQSTTHTNKHYKHPSHRNTTLLTPHVHTYDNIPTLDTFDTILDHF